MSAAVTFFISLGLLLAFFAFRIWEEKRGVRHFSRMRLSADETVRDMYQGAITGSIPRRYRVAFIAFLRRIAHESVIFLVESLRSVERPLTRLAYRMRMAAPNAKKKPVSPFLKTIAPEKTDETGEDVKTTNPI
jgi:hypothetical protein